MNGTEPVSTTGERPAASGFTLILVATAIVGVAGYVITWLVPRTIGVGPYAVFAVFWSFTFLIAAALSGIQQEVTRATRPRTASLSASAVSTGAIPVRTNAAGLFALVAFFVVLALMLGTAPLWVQAVFPTGGWALVLPLAVGAACYVPLAVLAGSLYGVQNWKAVFGIMLIEGVLRLILIGVVLLMGSSSVALAWAVAIPFPVAVVSIWVYARKSVIAQAVLDVTLPGLVWNITRTIVAAASMGMLVSGFPLVLSLSSPNVPAAELGLVILAATLTRAPLIVVGMALQSYLIVFFRSRQQQFWRSLLLLEGFVLVLGGVLSLLGYLLGPPVFAFLFPESTVPAGWAIAVFVASSAVVGALCISAPAVLSRNAHGVFTAGWVTAAVVTILCLVLPLDFITRTVLALLVGPAAGIVVHGTYLVLAGLRHRFDARTGDPES